MMNMGRVNAEFATLVGRGVAATKDSQAALELARDRGASTAELLKMDTDAARDAGRMKARELMRNGVS